MDFVAIYWRCLQQLGWDKATFCRYSGISVAQCYKYLYGKPLTEAHKKSLTEFCEQWKIFNS